MIHCSHARTPRVSVIVPIYNVELYLPRCLDSIIQNTYRNLEIICVNDGSSDNCLSILREYERQDNRIIVIDKENGGLSAARNAGMDVASGDFIAFIDSDDWIHPQYFETLLYFQQKLNADLTIAKHEISHNTEPDYASLPDYASIDAQTIDAHTFTRIRFTRNYVWGRLYRASLLKQHRFIEGAYYEDTPFNLILVCGNENIRIALISHPLYFYFMRASSIVHSIPIVHAFDVCEHYLAHTTFASSDLQKAVFMEQTLKKCLAIRYQASLERDTGTLARCRTMIQQALPIYTSSKTVAAKHKLRFTLLAMFPLIYRIFRLIDDPSLFTWERSIKAKRKDSTK